MENIEDETSMRHIVALSDDDFLEYLEQTSRYLDFRTPQQARMDLRDLDLSDPETIETLLWLADEDDFVCSDDGCDFDPATCACAHRLLDRLVAMPDDELAQWLDLTTLEKEREGFRHFQCLDCSQYTDREYYMVHNHLWLRVNPADDGMLCIGCLEARLGRTLTRADFTGAPVNNPCEYYTQRLKNRLRT
jgi:hypothetical protein